MKTAILITVLLIGFAALLAGCSDPKIDASDQDTLKASIQEVRESLPTDKKAEFDEALQILAMSQFDLKELLAGGSASAGLMETKVRAVLDGKSGRQVISEAAMIKSERRAKEREQARQEIRELRRKRGSAETAKEELAQFSVLKSRFYKRKEQYSSLSQPVIELTVRNGTDHAVARAYFHGVIASPDRSVPWHEDSFNYKIPGGLEPGETAEWSLSPNMFSEWGRIDFPKDAVFTVTVEQLDGANGEPLFSVRDFTNADMERLKALEAEFDTSADIVP